MVTETQRETKWPLKQESYRMGKSIRKFRIGSLQRNEERYRLMKIQKIHGYGGKKGHSPI